LPSRSTVQAPHSPRSHPIFVPVSPRWSRKSSTSVHRSSTSMRRSAPFTVRRIDVLGTDSTGWVTVDVCSCILGAAVTAASVAPVPLRNPLRERDRLVFFLDMGILYGGPGRRTRNVASPVMRSGLVARWVHFPPFLRRGGCAINKKIPFLSGADGVVSNFASSAKSVGHFRLG